MSNSSLTWASVPDVVQAYELAPGPLKVLQIKIMHGANYFSGGPIVLVRMDLGELDEVFTDQIPGFFEKLKTVLPTLENHHCSLGVHGGFFQRVIEGTLLGHVTEHVAIELNHLAGMDVGYGKTRSTKTPGVYHVAFGFLDEHAGVYSAKAAVNLVNGLLQHDSFPVQPVLDRLVEIRERRLLGPSTQAIVDAADRRQIPWLRVDPYNLVQLGTGKYRKFIRATITSDTNLIAVETADNTYLTYQMLKDAGVPVIETVRAESVETIHAFWAAVQSPLAIKPADGHGGEGVSLNVNDPAAIDRAFEYASRVDPLVLAQPMVAGQRFRMLVIDDQLVAASQVSPPIMKGDGRHTIAELIEIMNTDPARGIGDKSRLSRVVVDDVSLRILADSGLTPDSVPKLGQQLPLQISAAMRLGGSSTDVTDQVHPMNRFLAERAAKVIGLNIAGIDVLAPNLKTSLLTNGGAVLTVIAAPDFRVHLLPTQGKRRDVATPVVNMLFSGEARTRAPVFSITGSFGKTTTVHLIAQALKRQGHVVGMATSDGLYVADRCLRPGNTTRPEQVALVLKDPYADAIVLETPLEGILERGLGYRYADFGVVLNVHDNHPQNDELDYVEDVAYVKSVVAEQVVDDGFAVLNADCDLVLDMRRRVFSKCALFSRNYEHPEVRLHVDRGGVAAVLDRDILVILHGRKRFDVCHMDDIPLTRGGQCKVNDESILATAAALYAFHVPVDQIDDALRSYNPSPSEMPGNLNVFEKYDCLVIHDGAQHVRSVELLKPFLSGFERPLLAAFDLTHETEIEEMPTLAAFFRERFQQVWLVCEDEARGRAMCEQLFSKGFTPDQVQCVSHSQEAWDSALHQASSENGVVILSPQAQAAVNAIQVFLDALPEQGATPSES